MKNIHIVDLRREVPAEIRLEVYKDALDYLEADYYEKNWGGGLCLILPCALWDLPHYCSNSPDGYPFDYYYTIKAFPELTRDMTAEISRLDWQSAEKANEYRKNLLREWINQLENK